MPMSSKAVLDVVNGIGQPGIAGRAEAARRFSSRPRNNGAQDQSTLTQAQRDFLKAVSHAQETKRDTYLHPAAVAGRPSPAPSSSRPADPVALTAAQVAWLGRIPSDPSAVPFDDAVQLVRLARTVTAASDKPLVRSVAQPVVEYHDARAAQVDLANAQTPLARVPHEALAALADAISSEVPELVPDEAVQRASLALRESTDRRRAERDQNAAVAQRAIDAHEAAVADRLAVHR